MFFKGISLERAGWSVDLSVPLQMGGVNSNILLVPQKGLELLLEHSLAPGLDPQEREMQGAVRDKGKLFQMLKEMWTLWKGLPWIGRKDFSEDGFCFVL